MKDKVDSLEKLVTKLDITVNSLSLKIEEIASSLSTVMDGISKLAVTDSKLEGLTTDVSMLADAHRSHVSRTDQLISDLHGKINSHHENHDEPCEINTKETRESFDSKLIKVISFLLIAIVLFFEYNNMSIKEIESQKSTALLRIAKNESDIKLLQLEQKHAKELNDIKILLKKANGHRYHLAEEIKGNK